MKEPSAFTHVPSYGERRELPGVPAQEPVYALPVLPLPAPLGCLTLYPDGLVNLDGDATRTLALAAGVVLLPPGRGRGRWLLQPLDEAEPEAASLIGRDDRGHLRFRAAALAAALFALVPVEQKALRLRLAPGPKSAFRLELA